MIARARKFALTSMITLLVAAPARADEDLACHQAGLERRMPWQHAEPAIGERHGHGIHVVLEDGGERREDCEPEARHRLVP